MIRGEWRSIFHSKILWISVAVMILIPFLYSVFFLTSVWDPYGDTKNLPVAVVNEDKPVTYQGKRLAVGDEMVKNIKKNDQLGWHFVSADEAQAGLANHKYYTVVTIPANFSKHATTVTSKHPQKMKLHYSTNASLNYIAKVISDAGATQLNQNVRASVTKAYALAMFKQVKTAGKGFSKAADGSKKLAKGGKTLKAGLVTYTNGVADVDNGLKTLNGSTGELASGVSQLANGSSQVTSGSSQVTNGLATMNNSTGALTTGVAKLADGSGQVTSGLSTLNNSTGALSSGVVQLADGSKALKVGVANYTNGVYTLSTGLRTLDSKTGELSSGVTQLVGGSTILKDGVTAYTAGVAEANAGANELKSKTAELPTQATDLSAGATKADKTVKQLKDGSSQITDGLNALYAAGTSDENKQQIEQLQAGMTAMNAALTELEKQLSASSQTTANASKLSQLVDTMQTNVNTLTASSSTDNSALTEAINAKVEGLKDSQGLTDAQVSALESSLASVNTTNTNTQAANDLKTNMANLKSAVASSSTTDNAKATSLVDSFQAIEDGVNALITNVNAMTTTLNNLSAGSKTVTDGLAQLQDGTTQLSSGLNQLNGQVPTLVGGIGKLATGTDTLVSKSSDLNSGAGQVNGGLKLLNSQVPDLTSGVAQLFKGSTDLTDNSAALNSGASQLADGTAQLNKQVPTLVSGISALFAGSTQVSDGLNSLNSQVPTLAAGVKALFNGSSQVTSGSSQVTTGLNTLNDQVPALVTGVQKLTDGADQLSGNSPQLLAGIKQIKDGNGTLAKSLQSGADTVNATPLKNANAQMFATPSKLTHSNYSYVPNYGHALAPYVLSLALYVGAIVFNFAYPIRRMSDDDGTPTQWFLSKVAVGAPVAVLMALIECVALLIVGLKPISMAGYFTTAIMIALASMFIVMFLSMLFDNPGRFVAMVLLMLQLGGSGGTFPMEITNHFFNVIHPFLPLTYSILAFRQSLTGGWGNETFVSSIVILAIFAIVSLILLWASMVFLKQHNMQELAEEPIKMKAGK